ncbi:MAG: biopolymer transport protein ExbD [Puniceicoccaceae bacterium 5H]|nr:MAG: biopolymer transport protein ExbD [Puniceicoccaceae bacterium 5H]
MSESVIPPRPRRRPEINIVPLVDVLVVLIFFFLMFMQFRNITALNLKLPKIETAGKSDQTQRPIEIGLPPDGGYVLNGETLEEDALQQRLEQLAQENTSRKVLILADEDSRTKQLTKVMDLCRQLELNNISLQSR